MPATDFSQYLGMPQQVPAQSFFESVRPSGPSYEEERQMIGEGRRQLRDLRRMAPIFQAQQAQLAYDQVAEQARQLRQKQEIEAQVQRATEEITQGAIDPESDQFNQQALQFYGRNQLAFLDPRMKEAMDFLSNQNQQYEAARRARAEAEIKTQEDTRRRYLSALESGELMPQEIPAGATQEQLAFLQGRAKRRKEETELERKQREAAEQDRKSAMAWAGKRGVPTDLVNLMPDSASIYQLGSAYGGARGTSAAGGPVIKFYEDKLQALKAQADALSAKADETDDDKAREALQKQALDASQQFIDTNAEFIQKLDELNVTGGGAATGAAPTFTLPNYPYSREFRAGFEAAAGGVPAAVGGQFTVPGLTSPPAGGAAAPAPAPTSFRDTMAKLSGGAKPAGGGAPVIPDLTPEERVKDIESNKTDPVFLIAAIKSPQRDEKSKEVAFNYLKKLQEDPTRLQFSYGNPSDIQEAKREIQKTIEVYPALKEANRAWTTEKQNLEKMIEDFAKANSVTTSLMKTWLKNNVPIGLQVDPTGQAPARDVLTREAFDTFLRENSNMSLSDDAPILTKVAQKYPKRIQDLGLDRWFGLKMAEVLDAYLGEGNIKSATPAQ